MPNVEFRKDTQGKYRAEVRLPAPSNTTLGAQRKIERIVHGFIRNRPSDEFSVAHEAGHYNFWVAIDPKAPLDALKLTNMLMAALRDFVHDLTIDRNKLMALD